MAKSTKKSEVQLENKSKSNEENILLNSWHPHINNAIKNLHFMFLNNSNSILTEGDLQCWLFYFLEIEKGKGNRYSIHSEVTHKHDKPEVSKKKSNRSYRDLSLLCPTEIETNLDLIDQLERGEDLMAKGFRHIAPAIHFELKFIRGDYPVGRIKEDIEKLKNYQKANKSERRFVLVCGSREPQIDADSMKSKIITYFKELKIAKLTMRVDIYLFDKDKIIYTQCTGSLNSKDFKALTI